MSAIAFDRTGFEIKTSQPTPVSRPRPRDEEFRAALDRYMADYIACQKRCAQATEGAPRHGWQADARGVGRHPTGLG
jgi:hypothetical protein